MLVHGGAAHSGWWDAMLPVVATDRRVVLPDLSGHGDSDHRETYSAAIWADELAAVLDRIGDAPVPVVGHSMGGTIGVTLAARHPDLVASLVLIDSRLPLLGLPRPSSQPRYFASRQEALSRFRLAPPQTSAEPGLLRAIAERGLRETRDGWRWKFDPAARRRLLNDEVSADLRSVRCPVGYIYGTKSDLGGPDTVRFLERELGREVPSEAIAGAFHHVLLDKPIECAAASLRMIDVLRA
ncbi:alpha/beta hydrolase [Aeromicrobium sp. YIM 150415]|nr:alpha/beta hydrolase [Aeromicrobium sp. YIM 150415]